MRRYPSFLSISLPQDLSTFHSGCKESQGHFKHHKCLDTELCQIPMPHSPVWSFSVLDPIETFCILQLCGKILLPSPCHARTCTNEYYIAASRSCFLMSSTGSKTAIMIGETLLSLHLSFMPFFYLRLLQSMTHYPHHLALKERQSMPPPLPETTAFVHPYILLELSPPLRV